MRPEERTGTRAARLLNAAREPRLTDDARECIQLACGSDGGATERLFRCQWDHTSYHIADPVLIARGNRGEVSSVAHAFRGGEIALHTHPTDDPTPSKADLDVADAMAVRGIGFAVVNRDASKLHVVTTPDAVAIREPEATLARMRRRSWYFGPFTLLYARLR